MFSKETYTTRRDELKKRLGHGLVLMLGNNDQSMNYEDNTYPYRQDSTFLYYFGLPYAGLDALIDVDADTETIFGDELTIDDIVWMGQQPTIAEKAASVGVASTRPAADLRKVLDQARKEGRDIMYVPYYRPEHVLKLWKLMDVLPGQEAPSVPLIRAVADMRNHKTPEELREIEFACNVTATMHCTAMRVCRPGIYEYEIAAAIEYEAARQGCYLSFPTICTINGQTLHNHGYHNLIPRDRLVLIDAGAESPSCYAGDMSSTFPANGRFTDRQKAVYDIQVAAHLATVRALRPGINYMDVYDIAARTICEGMKGLGILKGDPAEAVKAGAQAMFIPHGLGHLLGMDVHDMENLGEVWVGYDGKPKPTQFGRKSQRLARPLEAGFCLTVEPGVYFIPELIDKWEAEKRFTDFIDYAELNKWRDFGGVRNEEDYLITPDGCRRLGRRIPLTTEEVEAEMNR